MSCNCACNKNNNTNYHIVTNITIGTDIANITVTNNVNLGHLQPFIYRTQCGVNFTQPTTPIPVTISINGTDIPLLDKNGIQINTSNIPRRACGRYIEKDATNSPYVILYTAHTIR